MLTLLPNRLQPSTASALPTLAFAAGVAVADVVEVDPERGREVALEDDAPAVDGVQLALGAAMARVLLLPAAAEAAAA